ncbi:hypothetical protein J2X56_001175 [Herbaspirillum sp. 1173]|uniref:hypothetical protein n=1 Tax=Herbaspirillum sp. 1173 TaxID=2817734 RepID=UPI00285C75C7|nr:hypothetical protein [Herbaspirillum sp. 1173]MDR6739189.1 hypothetical protein [Herbaspirillum sp. 1173]
MKTSLHDAMSDAEQELVGLLWQAEDVRAAVGGGQEDPQAWQESLRYGLLVELHAMQALAGVCA